MSRVLAARRVVLLLAALVFLALAVASAVAPQTMAEPLGYRLDNVNALNEFRAIYVGLWLAHAAIFAWAARRIETTILGDVAGLLLLGQVVGRVVGVAFDGLPDSRLLAPALAEAAGAALLLLLRPRPSSGR